MQSLNTSSTTTTSHYKFISEYFIAGRGDAFTIPSLCFCVPAQIDVLDVKAQTPLFSAVSGKHLDCVAALLRAGADPNGSPHNNCSPLLTAAREGDLDILRELLRFGADVDVRPKVPEWASNATTCRGPLYLSAVYGHLDCFKLLLLHGANPDYNCTEQRMLARIKQPKTVLEVCLRYGCGVEYIQLLIDFGANVYLPTLIIDKTTKQNEALALLLKERGESARSRLCDLKVQHVKYGGIYYFNFGKS